MGCGLLSLVGVLALACLGMPMPAVLCALLATQSIKAWYFAKQLELHDVEEDLRQDLSTLQQENEALTSSVSSLQATNQKLSVTSTRLEETVQTLAKGAALDEELITRHEQLIQAEQKYSAERGRMHEERKVLLRQQTDLLQKQQQAQERLEQAQVALLGELRHRFKQRALNQRLGKDVLEVKRQQVRLRADR